MYSDPEVKGKEQKCLFSFFLKILKIRQTSFLPLQRVHITAAKDCSFNKSIRKHWKNTEVSAQMTKLEGYQDKEICVANTSRHKRKKQITIFKTETHIITVCSKTSYNSSSDVPIQLAGRFKHLTVCVSVHVCRRTSAMGVTGMEDSIEQILLTDQTDFCHILLPVFRCQRVSWSHTHTHQTQCVLSFVEKKKSTWYIFPSGTVTTVTVWWENTSLQSYERTWAKNELLGILFSLILHSVQWVVFLCWNNTWPLV